MYYLIWAADWLPTTLWIPSYDIGKLVGLRTYRHPGIDSQLQFRVLPPLHSAIGLFVTLCRRLSVNRIYMKFDVGVFHEMMSRQCEFYAKRRIDRRTPLRGVIEFLPVRPTFNSLYRWNSVSRVSTKCRWTDVSPLKFGAVKTMLCLRAHVKTLLCLRAQWKPCFA